MELINDILDLSRIEAGELTVERIDCSPRQIIDEVARLMKVRAEEKQLQLVTESDSPVPEIIQSNPIRLRQILINLVGNAIKFTHSGEVRIRTFMDRDTEQPVLRLEVIDTGIGIDNELLDQMFQPFKQADDSTTRQFGGTGLGLSISRRLARMLGGDIQVRSEPGQGSTFSVTIETGSLQRVKLIRLPERNWVANTSGNDCSTNTPADQIEWA